ncbi:ABC transporter substrate-binding protein [Actinoplanes friuliensis]|uniref:Extracellular ligand-binding receptor n=1 Tax=Actinoplanes friuliensis DSM 7358 TaxID=1246995 RepID=U5VU52_9ACTN|nr:ABC transporter substrate-binding protein [Actinoplanes friuliensis]AGZ39240.1 extracellular ligand-binding receptor [Actinoplanes friuliensis DSM 7358]
MRLPRRLTASVVASTLVVTALAGCDSDTESGDITDIVIGADLASGDLAYSRALQLRVDQVNASGVLGNRRLVLRTQENRSDPTVSLRNVTGFARDPAVAAVIMGSCDTCVVNAAKTINDLRIPTIALSAADEVTSPVESRRYIFKLGPNSTDSSSALVAELIRKKAKTASLLYSDDLYGRGGRTKMVRKLEDAGIDVKASLGVKPTATDITQAVGTLTDADPDALVVWTGADQATLAATSAKAAAFTGDVYFDAAAAGDLFIPRAAAAATDKTTMVFTQILAIDDVIATTPAKATRKQWFRDYTSRYGSYSGVASFAADAVDLISEAVGKVGGDRQRLRDVLETSQTDGLSGPIRLTPDNHSGLMPQALTLLVARSGRWRLLS